MNADVLTIRKIRVASGDTAAARRAAGYTLDIGESPGAFSVAVDGTPLAVADGNTPAWMGSDRMLGRIGVSSGTPVTVEEFSLALQGRHAVTSERVRKEGMIQRGMVDRNGRAVLDARGRRVKERVRGTKSVDLTFSAPKSVSVVWSQAAPELRARIEPAMMIATRRMLEHMTETKPVVAYHRALYSARSFAGVAALHVTARTAREAATPAPQLHVHGVVLGVEREDGFFAAPELSGLFKHGAPLEGGAVARIALAEALTDLGFGIDCETGPRARFFEIANVPRELMARMSPRTRDVEAKIQDREAACGRKLTNDERSIAALQTRAPKGKRADPARTMSVWRSLAQDFGFHDGAVGALRCGTGFSPDLSSRRQAVRIAATRRLRGDGGPVPQEEARAVLYECAAGRLRLAETYALVREMEQSGELPVSVRALPQT